MDLLITVGGCIHLFRKQPSNTTPGEIMGHLRQTEAPLKDRLFQLYCDANQDALKVLTNFSAIMFHFD